MKKFFLIIFLIITSGNLIAKEYPSLMLSKQGVLKIRENYGKTPLFDKTIEEIKQKADQAILSEILVPVPKDGGGGITHEKHKDNYYAMYYCGLMFQITGDEMYAEFVQNMLIEYMRLYPSLNYHPVKMSSTPGRLFWQTLNDFVWLVHTSIAYDCIYEYLPENTRSELNEKLFKPMAEFLMNGNEANNKTFNKMHNHGTWAVTAVGMIGYVMQDKDLILKALYGSDRTGKNGGYIKQLQELFSPDGYFTEGAYYQRYAIWPFMIFAQAINNNDPQLKIFEYRDGIIKKAVNTLIQMTYNGTFFKLNDALTKGLDAQELVFAVNISYAADESQKELLEIAKQYQSFVLPTDAGFAVARDILLNQSVPFKFKSMLLRDGKDGQDGGLAIFRNETKNENSLFLMKATSHGLSHGHYDKLTISYYDDGNPILTDYGSSRFLNIVVKYNGGYTPLNDSFSMSTIAHNTVSVDMQNHFGGDIKISSKHSPVIYCYDISNPEVKVVSAIEKNAAPGVKMQRTNAIIENIGGVKLVLDIFKLTSEANHTYDLPFYYNGDMISLSTPYSKATNQMTIFGDQNGYQHLWKEASAVSSHPFVCFTWLKGKKFYSITTTTDKNSELYFVKSGANDPEYYLRNEPAFLIRQKEAGNHTFLTAIETHGKYDLVVEKTENAVSSVKEIKIIDDNNNYTEAEVTVNKVTARFRINYSVNDSRLMWTYQIINNQ